MLNIAVFFYPRKSKVPKKQFVSLFLLFFSRLKIFFSPTFTISYRAFWSFMTNFQIFSRVEFSFSRSERRILRYFFIWRGKFLFFALGLFFRLVKFCCFFSGTFCFSGSFQIFVSGSLKSSRTGNVIFFWDVFFLSGNIFQNYVPLPVCYSFLLFIKKYPLIHTYPYVPFLKN